MKQLFVYGTLKQGQCRAGHLLGQQISLRAMTQPDYRMYRLDGYPGLIEVEPQTGLSIVGELWEVGPDCLAQIDAIEGVDAGLFQRRSIRLAAPSSDDLVEAYFYLKSVAGRAECGASW